MSVIPVVAIIAAAHRRIVEHFRAAGALSPEAAIPRPSGRPDRMFDQLVGQGVIVAAAPDRYYLDEAELARRSSIKGIAMVFVAALAVVAVIFVIILATGG